MRCNRRYAIQFMSHWLYNLIGLGDWGIGGNPLTTNEAKALAVGKSKG
ncbi:MAG: hypothetical protein JWN70_1850 [Planctomycetaceae bacterium]|nr:hypothetical protein [Planctomycetaceae bacterium]